MAALKKKAGAQKAPRPQGGTAKAGGRAAADAAAPRTGPVRVRDLMARPVVACRPGDPLAAAAQIMWERDCGAVPVVDDEARLVGVVTDRDACMAAYTQGRNLHEIPVEAAMARRVVTLQAGDPLRQAHELMRSHRLRRLPVVDEAHRLVGLLSLKDLAHHAEQGPAAARQEVAVTLACIGRPGVEEPM